MKKWKISVGLMFVMIILSGCLYPEERLEKNQIPNEMQLQTVQDAIDKYREANNGLLPIKTRNMDTPIFQKYPVDFKKLKQYGFLAATPGNAFEEGGYYQYVIIDPENNPTVKVIDLRLTDKIREVGVKVEIFRNQHVYPPYGKQVANGIYELDYEKLGYKEPLYVTSPYSNQPLPIIIDMNGDLHIDYRKDLYELLRNEKHSYQPGDDIRYLLTDFYPFAPDYSLPYTIENGEPVFMQE
jgi:hypothetical protein